jgi:hypothetical protein
MGINFKIDSLLKLIVQIKLTNLLDSRKMIWRVILRIRVPSLTFSNYNHR